MPTNGGGFTHPNAGMRSITAALKPRPSFTATPLQVTWLQAVLSGKYNYLGIGGGIRGTKTFACLAALILLCRIYPRSRWAIVRKDLPTLRRNVVPSMEKLRMMAAADFVGQLNMSTWSYPCSNKSEILLFPEQFIQDPELERWKGLEVNGFDLEEGSELAEKSMHKSIERAGSWIIPPTADDPEPKQPHPLVFVNFNPCPNWPRKVFYEPWRNKTLNAPYYFLPATIKDNPHATEAYKESLKHLPPEEYKRFVEGEWDFVDDPNQLIRTEWIWDALNVEIVPGITRLSADIARFGDDATSIVKVNGNQLRKMIRMEKFDTTVVTTTILNEAGDPLFPVAPGECRVDGVGLGAGVVDGCKKAKLIVREVIAGAKPYIRKDARGQPLSLFRFKDLRSQIWWEFREKLRNRLICLAMLDERGDMIPIDNNLLADLATPRYEISGEKVISVESKDDIKERLGRSTDDGDAVVTAYFDFPPMPVAAKLPGSVMLSRGH